MFKYKVDRCPAQNALESHRCPFAHEGEQRQDPRLITCCATRCHGYDNNFCKYENSCRYAHGLFERRFHPHVYKRNRCNYPNSCLKIICTFTHNGEEHHAKDEEMDIHANVDALRVDSLLGERREHTGKELNKGHADPGSVLETSGGRYTFPVIGTGSNATDYYMKFKYKIGRCKVQVPHDSLKCPMPMRANRGGIRCELTTLIHLVTDMRASIHGFTRQRDASTYPHSCLNTYCTFTHDAEGEETTEEQD